MRQAWGDVLLERDPYWVGSAICLVTDGIKFVIKKKHPKSHPSSVFVRSIEIEIGDGNSIWLARLSHNRFELTEAMAYKVTRQYSTDLCNFSENIHNRLSVWLQSADAAT